MADHVTSPRDPAEPAALVQQLRALAEKATPTIDWRYSLFPSISSDEVAAFVHACDPQTILKLLDTLAEADAALAARTQERDALKDELASCCLCEYEFEEDQARESVDRRRNVVCAKCWPASAACRQSLPAVPPADAPSEQGRP